MSAIMKLWNISIKYNTSYPLPIVLEGDAKVEHRNEWQKLRERNSQLDKKRVQELCIIQGQCIQVLLYKMNHDTDQENTSA